MVWVVCWLFGLISCGYSLGWCVWLVGLGLFGLCDVGLVGVGLVFRL